MCVSYDWDRRCSWWSKHKMWDKRFLSLLAEDKNICRSKYISRAKRTPKPLECHDAWKWQCVLWNVSWHSCHKKATVSLVLSVWMKQSDLQFFHKIIMTNRNINRADMSQLYCMVGISNFDWFCFFVISWLLKFVN